MKRPEASSAGPLGLHKDFGFYANGGGNSLQDFKQGVAVGRPVMRLL